MKITTTKDFGSAKKPLLPLVPEPVEIQRKDQLTTLEILSDPTQAGSPKVKFTFKMLHGNETPREMIQWRVNVTRALVGLNSITGTAQDQMIKQFCRGSGLSNYNTHVNNVFIAHKALLVQTKRAQIEHDRINNGAGNAAALNAELNVLAALDLAGGLAMDPDGPLIVNTALNCAIGGVDPLGISL